MRGISRLRRDRRQRRRRSRFQKRLGMGTDSLLASIERRCDQCWRDLHRRPDLRGVSRRKTRKWFRMSHASAWRRSRWRRSKSLAAAHPPDVHRGSRRFFQYDYQLRIIGPDAIGHDVNIPPLTISYRIHSRVGAAATLEGRDLSYLMPMMPIKVLSLVPSGCGRHSRCLRREPRRRRFAAVSIEPVPGPGDGASARWRGDGGAGARAAGPLVARRPPTRASIAFPIARSCCASRTTLPTSRQRVSGDGWTDDLVAAPCNRCAWWPPRRSNSRSANGAGRGAAPPDGRLRVSARTRPRASGQLCRAR